MKNHQGKTLHLEKKGVECAAVRGTGWKAKR